MNYGGKYRCCRAGVHVPVDVEIQYNGDTLLLSGTCDICGADLETDVSPRNWDALFPTGKNVEFCPDCDEALPFCDCPEKK